MTFYEVSLLSKYDFHRLLVVKGSRSYKQLEKSVLRPEKFRPCGCLENSDSLGLAWWFRNTNINVSLQILAMTLNSKQDGLQQSAAMTQCKYVLFSVSEFSRHPEGLSFRDAQRVWVFRGWVSEIPRGSQFLGSEFSRHPLAEYVSRLLTSLTPTVIGLAELLFKSSRTSRKHVGI